MKLRQFLTSALLFLFLIIGVLPAQAQTPTRPDFMIGLRVMFGGRYDNVRMCVASDAGTPGGIMADVSLFMQFRVSKLVSVGLDIPVFRPALFGAAFKMLQFEPEVTVAFHHDVGGNKEIVAGFGVGLSFHYGPDYRASRENRGQEFFAAGPRFSGLIGLNFTRPGKSFEFMLGLRPFFSPLWARKHESGIVAGGALEAYMLFK